MATVFSRMKQHPELMCAAVLAVIVFTLSFASQFASFDASELHQHLGAEYYNIARALADGRGFSDPFAERTGPTAWMPPLIPFIIALLLTVLKTRSGAAMAYITLNNIALVATGTVVYAIARRRALRMRPALAVVMYVAFLTTFYPWFFLHTHDGCILALLLALFVLLLDRYLATGTIVVRTFGPLGPAIALASPALALAWSVTAIRLATRDKSGRQWIVMIVLTVAAACPWAIRNEVVFHRFVPMKSNLYFDAYQANVVDDDGVYDERTMAQHPFSSSVMRFEYARGEPAYLDSYRAALWERLAANPGAFLTKVANRAIAASLVYTPSSPQDQGVTLLAERAIYPLPLIALVAALWIRGPHGASLRLYALVAALYLAPYVLVAFYTRYWLPLTPLCALLVFLGVDQCVWALGREPALRDEPELMRAVTSATK